MTDLIGKSDETVFASTLAPGRPVPLNTAKDFAETESPGLV